MLAHGDEVGRTQRGNNNAYCQDSELAWVDWDLDDDRADLLAFTAGIVELRRSHPVFQRRRFFAGDAAPRRPERARRHRVVLPRRHRDGRRGLGQRLRAHADGVPQRRGHPGAGPARPADRGRALPAAVQRPQRPGGLHRAAQGVRRGVGGPPGHDRWPRCRRAPPRGSRDRCTRSPGAPSSSCPRRRPAPGADHQVQPGTHGRGPARRSLVAAPGRCRPLGLVLRCARGAPSRPRRRSRAPGHCGAISRRCSSSSCWTARRAYHLRSAGTTNHGAASVEQLVEHRLVGLLVGRPLRPLVDVAGVVLPVLVGPFEPLPEPGLLLVVGEVQHHLDDDRARRRRHCASNVLIWA